MTICVYGGSSNVLDAKYIDAAEKLGALMAQHGHTLVFGGGAQGIMGAAVRGITENGGRSIGVAPTFFNVDGILYDKCTEFIHTETMRERKAIMEEKSDAFIVMPGGPGTYEEFLEILTLKQLSRHCKAIAVFDQDGFYEPMKDMFEKAIKEKFLKPKNRTLCKFCTTVEEMLDYIESYHATMEDVAGMKNI